MAISPSTFNGTDLDQEMTAMLASLRDNAPTITSVFNRSMEAEMRSSEHATVDVIFPKQDNGAANNVIVRDRSADLGGNWLATVGEFDVGQIALEINRGGENGFSIKRRDVRRAPARSRARIASMNTTQMNTALLSREADVVDYMLKLTTYTSEKPGANDVSKPDNTGPNGNAGKIFATEIGNDADAGYAALSSVNGVPLDGGTLEGQFLDTFMTGLEDLSLRLLETNVTDGIDLAGDMDDVVILYVPHRVVRGLQTGLRRANLQGDNLTATLYRSMAAFGRAVRREELADINIVGVKALPNPSTAKGGYVGLLMTGNAVYYGEADVEAWSMAPVSEGGTVMAPRYEYRQSWEYGFGLVNSNQLIKVTFASRAPG